MATIVITLTDTASGLQASFEADVYADTPLRKLRNLTSAGHLAYELACTVDAADAVAKPLSEAGAARA